MAAASSIMDDGSGTAVATKLCCIWSRNGRARPSASTTARQA